VVHLGDFDEALDGAAGDDVLHLVGEVHQLFHVFGGAGAAAAEVFGGAGQHFHRALGRDRVVADAHHQAFDVLGGLGGALGELAHLVGHHREAAPGLTGPRRLDGRVEGQQVGLVGDLVDELDDGADLAGLLGEAVDLLGGGGGVFGQDVQAAGDLGGGLAARHRDMGRLEGAGLFFAEPGGHGGEALLGTGQGSAEQGQITQHGLEGLALAVLGLRQGLLLGEQLAEFDKLGVEGLLTSGEREVFGFERCNALFFWKNILVLGGREGLA
jgi:hypothetical protein